MRSFIFWQRWLFYSSLLFALFGITFAFWGSNPFFMPYNKMLATIFWQQDHFPAKVEPFRVFIWGPLGATITCCYILLAFIAKYPFARKELWSRNAIIIAFGVWVTIDSSFCIYFGTYPQLYLVNAFSILVKSLPIIFTWKEFTIQK